MAAEKKCNDRELAFWSENIFWQKNFELNLIFADFFIFENLLYLRAIALLFQK